MIESTFIATPEFEPVLKRLGLVDAGSVFSDPRIRAWRSITERENCTLDFEDEGRKRRFHVKRFVANGSGVSPAEAEVAGIRLLVQEGIPTVKLVAHGRAGDGRSFIIVEDLAGFEPGGRLIGKNFDFERVASRLAEFVARLHRRLHHRDLYLCHVFIHPGTLDLRLIDAGRVRRLPPWPFRRRWIIKDLAQLFYSMSGAGVSDVLKTQTLRAYAKCAGIKNFEALLSAVKKKEARIARHDMNLKRRNPERDVSLSY